jgi:hypothetical protein
MPGETKAERKEIVHALKTVATGDTSLAIKLIGSPVDPRPCWVA